ncbi:hypothetical protein GALL_436230 [mine drainage metagenome]|uniref:Uncharacterized protein n=1 Tax=mine drainage metagenome TaxID=410659 RepID=A0A1J5PTA4_9ZZZZ
MRADRGQRQRRVQPRAAAHHRAQQRVAIALFAEQAELVAAGQAVGVELAPHLFAPGPGRLAFGAFAPRRAGVLLQLVGAVEVGLVGRGVHARADAVAVDRRALRAQRVHRVLVEVAAGEDAQRAAAAGVENGAHAAGMLAEVAAVDAHAVDEQSVTRQSRGQRDDLVRGRLGVVGVDQQGRRSRVRAHEVGEGLLLVVVRLHVRVRHRAVQRDVPAHAGEHCRAAVEAGQVAGARRQQRRFGPVGAAHAEVDQQRVAGGQPHARCFRCDQGLVLQQVDHARFDQLRFAQRRDHAQDGFVGEERRALGHRVDVAAETQLGQTVDEAAVESGLMAQPVEFGAVEAQLLEHFQHLLEPGREQEIAPRGKAAHEELEHRGVVHAGRVVGLQHRQLVQVGEQHGRGARRHRGGSHSAAPASRIARSACAPATSSSAAIESPSSSTA